MQIPTQTIHLAECASTQLYLKENLEKLLEEKSFKPIIISTEKQISGVGRTGTNWDHWERAIAFSSTISPHTILTLTCLELSVLVCHFFAEKFHVDLKVKWPNDILTPEGKKCGGIITYFHSSHCLVAGIGINLFAQQDEHLHKSTHYKTAMGTIFEDFHLPHNFKQTLPLELYTYILNHRLIKDDDVKAQWQKLCGHWHKPVDIVDFDKKISGIFVGLGNLGEAKIQVDLDNPANLQLINAGNLYSAS